MLLCAALFRPLLQVFMLSTDAEVNAELLRTILAHGHSRLPVFEERGGSGGSGGGGEGGSDGGVGGAAGGGKNILGIILVKELLLVDEKAGLHVRDLRLWELPFMRWVRMVQQLLLLVLLLLLLQSYLAADGV